MKETPSSVLLSTLLCQENEQETCFDEPIHEYPFSDFEDLSSFLSDFDDGYIESLFQREINPVIDVNKLTFAARSDAITCIFHMRAILGFQLQTAYLSVFYLDQFVSKRNIDSEKKWAIQLLSVTCLSLAAKMEEWRVPVLSEFVIGAYNFESKVIQRMELLVLSTLDWKMRAITPFAYLPYLINKFSNGDPPIGVLSRSLHLIVAILGEICLMDYKPSAIASAAVLVALDHNLSRKAFELKINAAPSCRFLDIDGTFACYNIMQEFKKNKRSPKLLISHWIGLPKANPSHSSKRKSLTFDDIDQNHGLSKKRQC